MEVRCKYRDLDWGETQPGWMWDVNLGGLDGIQTQPGWMWSENLWTWMKVRWYMDGGDIIFFWPWLRWDRKRMSMRCKFWNLAGFETVSVWSWDATWMGVRSNTMDLHEVEMVHGCRWDNGIWIWIQWDRSKLDANLDGFRLSPEFIPICNSGDLVRDDTHLLGFGLVWYSTSMEVRCIYKGPHGVETLCGWKW